MSVPRTTNPGSTPGSLPASLRWAIWLLVVEAVAFAGLVAFEVYDTHTGTSLAHEARGVAGPLGVPLVVVGLAGAGLLLARSSREALGIH